MKENLSVARNFKEHSTKRNIEKECLSCAKLVDLLIKGRDGLLVEVCTDIQNRVPNLRAVNGWTNPYKRLCEMNNGIAKSVMKASRQQFDKVIYPYSGTDLMAPVPFANEIVTIDRDSIFDRTDLPDFSELSQRVFRKLANNFYYADEGNPGFWAYAMELSLLGANLDTFRIIREESLKGDLCKKPVITVQFDINTPDGNTRKITHTHISMHIPRNIDKNNIITDYLSNDESKDKKIILISKGGMGTAMIGFLYWMPNNSIILTDEAKPNFQFQLSSSQANIKLTELTPLIQGDLSCLQGGEPDKKNWIPQNLNYGYADDLRELQVYRVQR